jgi:hypothetical protein
MVKFQLYEDADSKQWVEVGTNTNTIKANKNLFLNGDFSVNQEAFDGDWSSLSVNDYGFDQWYKTATGEIGQKIEAGRYEPSTTHALSIDGVVDSLIVSPASGNWTIDGIADTATTLKVELGSTVTTFERCDVIEELPKCQRYYWRGLPLSSFNFSPRASGAFFTVIVTFPSEMASAPALTYTAGTAVYGACTYHSVTSTSVTGGKYLVQGTAATNNAYVTYGTAYIEANARLT